MRTGTGRTYTSQHNVYYDKTSTVTQTSDSAWCTHKLPRHNILIHDTDLDAHSSALAATVPHTTVLPADTAKDAQASSTYLADGTPLVPMYVSPTHVLRCTDHTVDNTVLACTLKHLRTYASVQTDAQASFDTLHAASVNSTVLAESLAPTGALRTSTPYLAARSPGTCPTDAQASADTGRLPERTYSLYQLIRQ